MKNILFIALGALLLSCASENDKNIEEAQFHLDHGEFTAAADLMEPMVAADSSNGRAKFILASALVGTFALEKKKGCPDDTGYLGLLACLLDGSSTGDSNGFKTFERISPSNDKHNENIRRAVTLLLSIDKSTIDLPEKDVAMQRMIARVFDISSYFELTGANSSNVQCNSNIPGPTVDHVPDDYDTSPITAEKASILVDDIRGLQVDADLAGFAADFGLITRAGKILDDLRGFNVSTQDAVKKLFDNAYNTASKQVCN